MTSKPRATTDNCVIRKIEWDRIFLDKYILGVSTMMKRIIDTTKNRWMKIGLSLLLLSLFFVPTLDAQSDDGDATSIELRSLSEVYADGPPTIVDLNATYATVAFVSSVPLACSVVYGVDTTYGQIATDLDMAGGAHTTHQPLLAGLTADTEYTYRVQGTDASGNIYISEPMTFRTPTESTGDPQNEVNVASAAAGATVVDVSSNSGNGPNHGIWGADFVLDGNPATAWSSNGDGNDAFIEVQLSEPSVPHAVEVWTRTMSNGTAQISTFTLTSNSGTATSETFGPFTLPDAFQAYRFEIAPTQVVNSLRLDVLESSGGNTGLLEFGVFAGGTAVATTTQSVNLFLPFSIQ